jgi:hypothetical protein
MSLSSNPYTTSNRQDDGKWGDIGGIMDVGPIIKLTPGQVHDAQLSAVELVGYDPEASLRFLEMLGIDRKVEKDGVCQDN